MKVEKFVFEKSILIALDSLTEKTSEFNNDSILKHSLKQCDKEGFQLIDCQLTVTTICPEAIRMGWPSALPSNWCCTRTISKSHPESEVVNPSSPA